MDQTAEGDQLEDRLCLVLYQASHAMTASYRKVLQPLGLTYPQYTVMSALWRTDPVTIKDLSGLLDSDYSTMSPLIQRLEAKALVRRTRSTTDEREVLVHLTVQGHELRDRAQGVQPAIRGATELSDAERDGLVNELHQLTARLQHFNRSGRRLRLHAAGPSV